MYAADYDDSSDLLHCDFLEEQISTSKIQSKIKKRRLKFQNRAVACDSSSSSVSHLVYNQLHSTISDTDSLILKPSNLVANLDSLKNTFSDDISVNTPRSLAAPHQNKFDDKNPRELLTGRIFSGTTSRKFCDPTPQEPSNFAVLTMNLSFAGSGFLGMYHLGVAKALVTHGSRLLINVQCFTGASAGVLIAAVLAIRGPDREALQVWTTLHCIHVRTCTCMYIFFFKFNVVVLIKSTCIFHCIKIMYVISRTFDGYFICCASLAQYRCHDLQ